MIFFVKNVETPLHLTFECVVTLYATIGIINVYNS